MRTYLECIPCFFRQALIAARLAGADEEDQKRILDEVAGVLPTFSLNATPPEMGRIIHRIVMKITGKEDPYRHIKEESTRKALTLYPQLKEILSRSDDRLRTAVNFAIAGNSIDYGARDALDIEKELVSILNAENRASADTVFDYSRFRDAFNRAETILYLGDNVGETVFDRLLIEEMLQQAEKRITYVVRERPIINDALIDDARQCGIDELVEIISSGSDAPGTLLSICSPEFLERFHEADMIISKGQGNFETLSEARQPIFFLFMAKCQVIARDIGCRQGDMVLCDNTLRGNAVPGHGG
jgi:uncharacterized protein with ATP-grasp and redox domains